MIFSVLASGVLAAALLAALVRRFDFPLLRAVMFFGSIAGLWFVWHPAHLTWIAHRIGVGRGADLVTYSSALLFFLTVLAIAVRRRASEQQITTLVREVAILHARKPAAPAAPSKRL